MAQGEGFPLEAEALRELIAPAQSNHIMAERAQAFPLRSPPGEFTICFAAGGGRKCLA